MERWILAIDQSTSGTKAILFDESGRLVLRRTMEHTQYYPHPGWVEHDAVEIDRKLRQAATEVLEESGIDRRGIAAVAITNQRETTLVWDADTGTPVYNAIVWQCGRAGAICKELIERGYGPSIQERTGLVVSPYFSAPKVKWILDNVPGVREKAEAGRLCFGTMDSWVVWQLTGGKVHATDFSNASRTMLFNIHDRRWDPELLGWFGIPESMMPAVRSSDEIFGHTTLGKLLPVPVPVTGVMGDSQAALFGQNCFGKGMAKATYGTGSSIMMNIGERPLLSQQGLVTSIAWGRSGRIDYVLEGNINCAGDTIKWLADGLELISDSRQSESIAASLADNDGVYLVPAFLGLGAPYWDSDARASITGMSRGTKRSHLVRAALESIAYQVKDIIDLMIQESGIPLRELRVDGGPTRNEFLMKFQADLLNGTVVRSGIAELSALGAAYMAGLAVGLWQSQRELQALRTEYAVFSGDMSDDARKALYRGWREAVRRTLSSR